MSDPKLTVTTSSPSGTQGSFGTEGASISHGNANLNFGTDGKAQASYEAVVTTPNGIAVSYSQGFWEQVYNLPPAQLISFGNALNSISSNSAAAVRVYMDKDGSIIIAGVDGSISASGKAEIELTRVDLDKRTNQPLTLEGEAKAKGGASFIQVQPGGTVLKLNVSAQASGTIDITAYFKQLSEKFSGGKFDKKGIVKWEGKAGFTGTVFQKPKFSIDPATQGLIVHQNIGSASYFYTLKPDLKGSYESEKKNWEATVQVGNHEVSLSYKETILSDPFSYICSTNQTKQLDALRMDLIRSSGVLVDRTDYRAVIEQFENPAKAKLQVISGKIPTPTKK